MANPILLKRTSTPGKIPLVGDLSLGELALNTYDGKMFIKKNVGGTESVIEIGTAATEASKLSVARTIALSGDATGSTSFDGSANATIAATLASVNTSGPGAYTKVTVNAKGLVTLGEQIASSDVTTALGYTPFSTSLMNSTNTPSTGVYRDASGNFAANIITATGFTGPLTGNADTATKLATARSINGVNFDGSANITIADSTKLPLGGGTLTGYLTLHADPTNAMHAVTKQYADALKQGLDWKDSVRAASNSNVNIASPGTSIGGVTMASGNRVLLFGQSTASQNGIWIWNGSTSSMTRATDADADAKVTTGMYVFVEEGTFAQNGYVMTTTGAVTLGTTSLTFTQFSGAGQISAGNGMTKTGNTLDIGTASTSRIVINADNIDLATIAGLTTGTYQGLTIDAYGRVTSASNMNYLTANQSISITGDASGSGTTAITLTLATQAGLVAGSYPKVTVNTKGIVTAAGNLSSGDVTTGLGFTPANKAGDTLTGTLTLVGGTTTVSPLKFQAGSLLTTPAFGALEFNGTNLYITNNSGSPTRQTIAYTTSSISGNAATATKLETARTINGVAFDGTANITISSTVSNSLTAGTYLTGGSYNGSAAVTIAVDATSTNTASKVVARDANGDFSAGTITAALSGNASTATKWATTRTITMTGDATSSATNIDGSANVSIATTLATQAGLTPGTYNSVTVNAKGIVTAASNVNYLSDASEIDGGTF